MQTLGPAAVSQIFDNARRQRSRNAHGPGDARAIQPDRCANSRRASQRADDGGGMKARFMHCLRRHQRHAAHDFNASCNALHHGISVKPALLRNRQNRWYDDGAGMHRAAFKRIVEILAMGRRAVDQRRVIGVHGARVANGGDGSIR